MPDQQVAAANIYSFEQKNKILLRKIFNKHLRLKFAKNFQIKNVRYFFVEVLDTLNEKSTPFFGTGIKKLNRRQKGVKMCTFGYI